MGGRADLVADEHLLRRHHDEAAGDGGRVAGGEGDEALDHPTVLLGAHLLTASGADVAGDGLDLVLGDELVQLRDLEVGGGGGEPGTEVEGEGRLEETGAAALGRRAAGHVAEHLGEAAREEEAAVVELRRGRVEKGVGVLGAAPPRADEVPGVLPGALGVGLREAEVEVGARGLVDGVDDGAGGDRARRRVEGGVGRRDEALDDADGAGTRDALHDVVVLDELELGGDEGLELVGGE